MPERRERMRGVYEFQLLFLLEERRRAESDL